MRLAVYARSLSSAPTGRGVVARELVLALQRVLPTWEIHLFATSDPGWPGVEFHPARGSDGLADLWQSVRGLGRAVRRLRPDAVWSATHLLPLGLPAGLPRVVTLLDVVWRDHPETMRRLNRAVARAGEGTLLRADRIACISEFTRSRLAARWPALDARARIVHLAPGSTLIAAAPAALEHSDDVRIANVGTREPRKNLKVLLGAMEQLPDAVLWQYGGAGWATDDVVARAREMRNVRLLGYGDAREIATLYRTAAVATFPSIYEGFDLPPLEAMALGCPVVASDIPVHREVLGDAALFVPPTDSVGLAAVLRRVIDDPIERSRLIRAGSDRARLFSWDRAATMLAGIIEEAVADRDTRRRG